MATGRNKDFKLSGSSTLPAYLKTKKQFELFQVPELVQFTRSFTFSFKSLSKTLLEWAVFNWESVIGHCIGFASIRSVIGPGNSPLFLNQWDAKLKTNHDLVVCVFPRFKYFACFYLEFFKVFLFLFIDCCGSFGWRFTTLNWNMLSCLPWVHCDKHSTICIQLYVPSLKQKPVKQTSSHIRLEKRKSDRPHRYNLD